MFGESVATTENNNIVEDDSDMPNDDFCFTEDGSIEASQQLNDIIIIENKKSALFYQFLRTMNYGDLPNHSCV